MGEVVNWALQIQQELGSYRVQRVFRDPQRLYATAWRFSGPQNAHYEQKNHILLHPIFSENQKFHFYAVITHSKAQKAADSCAWPQVQRLVVAQIRGFEYLRILVYTGFWELPQITKTYSIVFETCSFVFVFFFKFQLSKHWHIQRTYPHKNHIVYYSRKKSCNKTEEATMLFLSSWLALATRGRGHLHAIKNLTVLHPSSYATDSKHILSFTDFYH